MTASGSPEHTAPTDRPIRNKEARQRYQTLIEQLQPLLVGRLNPVSPWMYTAEVPVLRQIDRTGDPIPVPTRFFVNRGDRNTPPAIVERWGYSEEVLPAEDWEVLEEVPEARVRGVGLSALLAWRSRDTEPRRAALGILSHLEDDLDEFVAAQADER